MPAQGRGIDKRTVRVTDPGEFQAVGRGCHAKGQPIPGFKGTGKSVRRKAAQPDFSCCAGNDADHVTQKSVSGNGEDPFAAADDKTGFADGAHRGFRGSAGGLEGGEIMPAGQVLQGPAYGRLAATYRCLPMAFLPNPPFGIPHHPHQPVRQLGGVVIQPFFLPARDN